MWDLKTLTHFRIQIILQYMSCEPKRTKKQIKGKRNRIGHLDCYDFLSCTNWIQIHLQHTSILCVFCKILLPFECTVLMCSGLKYYLFDCLKLVGFYSQIQPQNSCDGSPKNSQNYTITFGLGIL